MSRIAPALDDLIGIEDPDDLMVEIMDLLSEGGVLSESIFTGVSQEIIPLMK